MRRARVGADAASRESVQVGDESDARGEHDRRGDRGERAAREQQRREEDDAAIGRDRDVVHAERVQHQHQRRDDGEHEAQEQDRGLVVARAHEPPRRDPEGCREREDRSQCAHRRIRCD